MPRASTSDLAVPLQMRGRSAATRPIRSEAITTGATILEPSTDQEREGPALIKRQARTTTLRTIPAPPKLRRVTSPMLPASTSNVAVSLQMQERSARGSKISSRTSSEPSSQLSMAALRFLRSLLQALSRCQLLPAFRRSPPRRDRCLPRMESRSMRAAAPELALKLCREIPPMPREFISELDVNSRGIGDMTRSRLCCSSWPGRVVRRPANGIGIEDVISGPVIVRDSCSSSRMGVALECIGLIAAKRSCICSGMLTLDMNTWRVGDVLRGSFGRTCRIRCHSRRVIAQVVRRPRRESASAVFTEEPVTMTLKGVSLGRTQGPRICSDTPTLDVNAGRIGRVRWPHNAIGHLGRRGGRRNRRSRPDAIDRRRLIDNRRTAVVAQILSAQRSGVGRTGNSLDTSRADIQGGEAALLPTAKRPRICSGMVRSPW